MPVTGLKDFNTKCQAFVKTIPQKASVFQKKIALEALRGLVFMTPVDTGRARGNWQVDIDAIPLTVIGSREEYKGRKASKTDIQTEEFREGQMKILGMQPNAAGHVIFIVNNVEYIIYLEEGRSKTQAPDGMRDVTFQNLLEMFS